MDEATVRRIVREELGEDSIYAAPATPNKQLSVYYLTRGFGASALYRYAETLKSEGFHFASGVMMKLAEAQEDNA